MTEYSGGCLCGTVRYEGQQAMGGGHCFCIDCRKSSGTSHGSHMIAPAGAFNVKGELRFFDSPADSGNTVNRGFCPNCGSAIYSTNSGFEGMVFIRASSLDDPNVFTPQMTVYVSRTPDWAQPNPDLPQFAEMPPPADLPEEMQS